ncbi:Spo0E family sporulation regulatory protein-aspartic acid phosphatase [Virgibacillus kekensis]|uniref:Spo0E family sporulation regulatory protein-aspartic acid phosphatase n=1 Tax=Virgibacillus kekensis TaxID=202261 RepID=A0ABV9DJV4_9BACI
MADEDFWWRGRGRLATISKLEERIESTRRKMYQIYKDNPTDHRLLLISQELDQLLNQLERASNGNQLSEE